MTQITFPGSSVGEADLDTLIIDTLALAVVGIGIGIIAFFGMAVYTSIASLIIPTINKIVTWELAASELKSCILLSFENIIIQEYFNRILVPAVIYEQALVIAKESKFDSKKIIPYANIEDVIKFQGVKE